MKTENKGKTITFRLNEEQHKKCLAEAIKRTNSENRIVQLSEIIRESLDNFLK
jgi:hypothetical protein